MQTTARSFLLLTLLMMSSLSEAQESIVVDFEQAPLSTQCFDWYPIYDQGAAVSGGGVVNSYFSGINETKVYNTAQPIYTPCGRVNPLEIHFDEPTFQVTLDLMTPNDFFTIEDDTGWSQVISVRAGRTGCTYCGTTVQIPSEGVTHIKVTDQCDYYATNGCNSQWRFAIDNVTFTPQRPCLAVTGDPIEVEPNDANSSDPLTATDVLVQVTDCEGTAIDGIKVKMRIAPVELSGGHKHEVIPFDFRPAGQLRERDTTDAGTESIERSSDTAGEIRLAFVPSEFSGTYEITAECVDQPCYAPDPRFEVEVKVDGIEPIPAGGAFYTLTEYLQEPIGKNIGDNGQHDGVNHNLTPDAAETLRKVAFYYAAAFDFFEERVPEKLHINDASLPLGGLFDVGGNWRRAHNRHRKGTVVDIRGNQAPGAIPEGHRARFEKAARYAGAEPVFEKFEDNPSRNHYHLLLRGVQE